VSKNNRVSKNKIMLIVFIAFAALMYFFAISSGVQFIESSSTPTIIAVVIILWIAVAICVYKYIREAIRIYRQNSF
jgi:lipopolysaccharide export LptBFGC system permease protein LptF